MSITFTCLQLVKVNMDTKEVKYWLDEADYHVLGEPVFVATPGGTTEDDGE